MPATQDLQSQTAPGAALADLLGSYSLEVTAHDKKSLEAAPSLLRPGTEVFIAAIPGETDDKIVSAAVQLRRAGMVPVPHIVARNLKSLAHMDELIRRLVGEAGLDRALALGGDRDKPEGDLNCSLQLIESGVFQKHGVKKLAIACYPEGHPRIKDEVLEEARATKLKVTRDAGFDVTLISQFCFDADPIVSLAERMRAQGASEPYRVGVAGPADRGKLVKYALMCGVGASLRALRERHELAKSVMAGETPENLLTEVALAQSANPALGISSVHFFTFGSLEKSARWAEEVRARAA